MTCITLRRHLFRTALLAAAWLVLLATAAPQVRAQGARSKYRGFWIAAEAEVTVKPDQAIVIALIRSSGATASLAQSRNDMDTIAVEHALDGLGLRGRYRFSEAKFEEPELPRTRNTPFLSRPMQAQAHLVEKYVFVTFECDELALPDFEQTIAQTIDGISKAAGECTNFTQVGLLAQTPAVLFTIRNFEPALREANRLAAARARAMADEEAKILGVRITGIIDARVNRPLELTLPQQQAATILDELQLQYYSTTKDGLRIPATFAVEYSIR